MRTGLHLVYSIGTDSSGTVLCGLFLKFLEEQEHGEAADGKGMLLCWAIMRIQLLELYSAYGNEGLDMIALAGPVMGYSGSDALTHNGSVPRVRSCILSGKHRSQLTSRPDLSIILLANTFACMEETMELVSLRVPSFCPCGLAELGTVHVSGLWTHPHLKLCAFQTLSGLFEPGVLLLQSL